MAFRIIYYFPKDSDEYITHEFDGSRTRRALEIGHLTRDRRRRSKSRARSGLADLIERA